MLVVTMDDMVETIDARPGMRLIASWSALPDDEMQALLDERDQLEADIDAAVRGGDPDPAELEAAEARLREISAALPGDGGSIAYRAAVFVDETFRPEPVAG